jgi:parallel beta-helix repeat protein
VVFSDAESGDPLLEGFTVTGGTLGGVWAINADATIRNNIIRGNDHTEGNNQTGGGVFIYNNSTATVVDNVIEDNTASSGGGIAVSFTLTGDVPVISGNTIRGNTATDTGGGIFVGNGSPVIFGNRIEDNAAPNQDGGGLAVLNTFEFAVPMQLQVVGNVFSGNSASEDGGGVFCIEDPSNAPAYFANNLLTGNSAQVGGAMALRYDALLVNNTITGNVADERGGAIFRGGGGGMIEIVNSILWNNDAVIQPEIGGGGGGGVQTLSVAYSNVAGGVTGTGNIDLAPEFVSAGSDYRLAATSPCIDTGTNEVILDGDLDLDGEARIAGATVDMGCYEFQTTECPGDLDGNDAVDGADLTLLLGQWGGPGSADFDQSGTVDGADLAQLLGYWGGCDGG